VTCGSRITNQDAWAKIASEQRIWSASGASRSLRMSSIWSILSRIAAPALWLVHGRLVVFDGTA
jgi:hypothetical protein